MQKFIAKANIANFEKLLATTTDPVQARFIRELLALEKAKHSQLTNAPTDPDPPTDP
jgi:hypothetical protein